MGMRVTDVKLSRITVPDILQQGRGSLFTGKGSSRKLLSSLMESIQKEGLLSPIMLRKGLKRGDYEIVFGLRRFLAFGFLNEDSEGEAFGAIPCFITEIGPEEAASFAHAENARREKPTFASICALAHHLTLTGMNPKEVAAAMSEPASTIRRALAFWKKACPELKDALSKGQINRDDAESLSEKPEKEQQRGLKTLLKKGPITGSRAEKSEKTKEALGVPPKGNKDKAPARMSASSCILVAEELTRMGLENEEEDESKSVLAKAVAAAFLVAAGKLELAQLLGSLFGDGVPESLKEAGPEKSAPVKKTAPAKKAAKKGKSRAPKKTAGKSPAKKGFGKTKSIFGQSKTSDSAEEETTEEG